MKCARVRSFFSSYLENEMDVPARSRFEEHLAECSACKAAYDRFNAAVVMLDEMPELDPPAGFHESVMTRVRQAQTAMPAPVKWWNIDWQHVFTIRVPARGAALGLAAILLLAVLVQVTPVGTGVMNLLGIGKHSTTTIGLEPQQVAPPMSLQSDDVAYDVKGSGLLIAVRSEAEDLGTTYALRLQTGGDKPVTYCVTAKGQVYDGTLKQNQDSVITVSVVGAEPLLVAQVNWKHDGRRYVQRLFLPRQFDPNAHIKKLNFHFDRTTAYDVIRTIAKDYGVVIIASGDLNRAVPFAEVVSGDPAEALYQGVEASEANMRKRPLGPSIFAVEPVN